jgi:hypothetical protein
MKKLDPISDLNARRSQFIIDLTSMKASAGQLGLWRTMQAIDSATNAAGWELADLISGRQADSVAKLAAPQEEP